MADGTKIEWTDASINPIRARRAGAGGEIRMGWHCEHVSEACRHCYAEAINRDRFGTGLDYKPGHLAAKGGEVEIVFVDKPLRDMLRWRRPRRVFVCSMTDLFADFVPDWMIDRVFAAAALCPQHTIQILTKRPERMRAYMSRRDDRGRWPAMDYAAMMALTGRYNTPALDLRNGWPLPNVLLDTPAAKRFVSIEPMLGPVHLGYLGWPNADRTSRRTGCSALTGAHYADGEYTHKTPRLDWVICGGESGPDARPMHPDWARSLRDQCAAAGVPFFFKQWGEFTAVVDRERDDPDWRLDYSRKFDDRHPYKWLNLAGGCGFHGERFHVMHRVGKSRAGRLLDGVTHDALPEGVR